MGVFQVTPQATETPESKDDPIVPNNTETETDDKSEPKVVLDGPLSNIYTQALNLVFAKEAVMTVAAVLNHSDELEANKQLENPQDIYVYCVDPSSMTKQELVEATNKLITATESKSYRQVILAIESHNAVSKKTVLLHDLAQSIGLEVHFSKNAAIGAVHAALESYSKR